MAEIPDVDDGDEGDLGEQRSLHDYLLLVWRRRLLVLAVFLAVLGLAAFRTFSEQPVYEASARILIQLKAPRVVSFGDGQDAPAPEYLDTHFQLLQSRSLARRLVEDLGLLQHPAFGGPRPEAEVTQALAAPVGESAEMEGAIDGLLGNLRVAAQGDSYVVAISFQSSDPALAARVPNRLAQLYIKQRLEQRFEASGDAAAWLEEQVATQRARAQEADRALAELVRQEGIGNVEERRALLDQRVRDLSAALTAIKRERLEKEAVVRHMSRSTDTQQLAAVLDDAVVRDLRVRLAVLQSEQARLAETYGEKHPVRADVEIQIKDVRARLASESARVVAAARDAATAALAREGSIARDLELAQAESQELTRRSGAYEQLKHDREATREVLDRLVARARQTDVTREIRSSPVNVVDDAVVPRWPIRPNHRRSLALGGLLGLALGVGLAFLLDYLDRTLRTADDVRAHVKVPLLGVIVENPEGEKDIHKPYGSFAEGYRMLRTALGFSWGDRAARMLVVTSAASGEGKTLTSVNLALTLAATEARVLLVDCDLRRPRGHLALAPAGTGAEGWTPHLQPGFSDVVIRSTSFEEAVQRVPGAGLDFLAAGSPVPSAADFLTATAVREMLPRLRERYDWVVVDTPPVTAVTDAVLLAPLSDGVVVVVGAGMAARSVVRDTIARLTGGGARVLGVVLNRARIQHHAYGYGYGDTSYYSSSRRAERPVDLSQSGPGAGRLPS